MAEALRTRGLAMTVVEQLPQVLSTVDADLADLVADELARHDVRVHTSTTITAVDHAGGRITVSGHATRQPTNHRGHRSRVWSEQAFGGGAPNGMVTSTKAAAGTCIRRKGCDGPRPWGRYLRTARTRYDDQISNGRGGVRRGGLSPLIGDRGCGHQPPKGWPDGPSAIAQASPCAAAMVANLTVV